MGGLGTRLSRRTTIRRSAFPTLAALVSGVLTPYAGSAAADEVAMSPYGPQDQAGRPTEPGDVSRLAILSRIGSGQADDLLVENVPGMPGHAWLEDLARDRVHEFVLIAAPIKVRGATGSSLRPLAIPLAAAQP